MALISLSDWLDRFGDASTTHDRAEDLESLRFTATESPSPPPHDRRTTTARARWRERLRRAYRRVFWRLKRLPSGHA